MKKEIRIQRKTVRLVIGSMVLAITAMVASQLPGLIRYVKAASM